MLLHAGTVHTLRDLHDDRTIPFCKHLVYIISMNICLQKETEDFVTFQASHRWKERDFDKDLTLTVVAIKALKF